MYVMFTFRDQSSLSLGLDKNNASELTPVIDVTFDVTGDGSLSRHIIELLKFTHRYLLTAQANTGNNTVENDINFQTQTLSSISDQQFLTCSSSHS